MPPKEINMPSSVVSADIEWSAEVQELAGRLGVTDYLRPVWEMTRSVFPAARLEYEAYQDHELADEWWIVMVVWHSFEDPVELVAVTTGWHRRLFDCCPAHLAGAFSIDTSFRP